MARSRVWSAAIVFLVALLLGALWSRRRRYSMSDDGCRPLYRSPTNDGMILVVSDACKEGLPHTTDSETIIFPESAWKDSRREVTLKHERVHLAQKRALKDWYAFYENEWDYSVHPTCPAGVPAALIAAMRPNPDTADAPFAVWKRRYVFFPIYRDPAAPTLRDAVVVVWDLQTGRRLDAPPAEWKAEFCTKKGCPYQYEHPHELSAVFLAEGGGGCSAERKLFAWRQ